MRILVALALVVVFFDAERPESYLVAALAGTSPDIDASLFYPLTERGCASGALWAHGG